VEGSLETIAEAFDQVGVGHLLCYEISDRDGKDIARRGLDETRGFLKSGAGLVGLHASFTVDDETLASAVDLASETHSGIHIHVAEDFSDQLHCREHYGLQVVERLHRAGALAFQGTILGHCLHLSEKERMLVAQSPAWVVQNMESNLNNRVGKFNSDGLGPRIMLGTDGMHSDMIRSARAAFFAGQEVDRMDYSECYRRFRNVHHYLSGMELDTGENNLVVLDYRTPTPIGQGNFLGHFLFGIESRQIKHVLANGVLIVEDGKVVQVDEQEILALAREQAVGLWRKL
jgi:cytosine/adenosine deaminase-related metal-dependent hydrolase